MLLDATIAPFCATLTMHFALAEDVDADVRTISHTCGGSCNVAVCIPIVHREAGWTLTQHGHSGFCTHAEGWQRRPCMSLARSDYSIKIHGHTVIRARANDSAQCWHTQCCD